MVRRAWWSRGNAMTNMTAKSTTIGAIAKKAGVGVETVRFYEEKGLIARPRKPMRSFRDYPADTARRIRFIRQAQELGFSLAEIAQLLALSADPSADCADVRARAKAKLDEVTAKVANLERMAEVLKRLVTVCPGRGALDGCSILEAFAADEADDKPRLHRSKET